MIKYLDKIFMNRNLIRYIFNVLWIFSAVGAFLSGHWFWFGFYILLLVAFNYQSIRRRLTTKSSKRNDHSHIGKWENQ
jgi:hypothetical protein